MSRGETVTVTEHEQEGMVRLSQVVIALEHGCSVWEPVRKATFPVVKNSKGDRGSYLGKLLGVPDTQRFVGQTVVTNLEECWLVVLRLNVPVNNFSVMSGREPSLPG